MNWQLIATAPTEVILCQFENNFQKMTITIIWVGYILRNFQILKMGFSSQNRHKNDTQKC